MNILITGANGQLGCSLRRLVANPEGEQHISAMKGEDIFYFSDVSERPGYPTVVLDITDLDEIRIFVRNYDIDVIVNCAAYTNVDAAESNEALAEKLNAKAAENLAIAMKEVGGLLVHISTDYVFGGDPYNTPCKEDQTGTPTYASDLANAILTVIQKPVQGIYHYSNEGVCSWYDFTKMIQQLAVELETPETSETFGTHGACEVLPCHSDEFPSPVKRPAYSVLDKAKIKETFGIKIPYWAESLRRCIELECMI